MDCLKEPWPACPVGSRSSGQEKDVIFIAASNASFRTILTNQFAKTSLFTQRMTVKTPAGT